MIKDVKIRILLYRLAGYNTRGFQRFFLYLSYYTPNIGKNPENRSKRNQ